MLGRVDALHEDGAYKAAYDLALGAYKALPHGRRGGSGAGAAGAAGGAEASATATQVQADKVQLTWRLARECCSRSGKLEVTDPHLKGKDLARERERVVKESVSWCKRTLKLDPLCADGHKWLSVCLGAAALFGSTKEQIANAYVIRDHAREAARLNPSDHITQFILGQWCEAVAGISLMHRLAAKALFGAPPEATWDEAYAFYRKSETLKPGAWVKTRLKLSLCCDKLGRTEESTRWLREAVGMDVGTMDADDAADHAKAVELLRGRR